MQIHYVVIFGNFQLCDYMTPEIGPLVTALFRKPALSAQDADIDILTSSARLEAFIFDMIVARWLSTVRVLIPSSRAMILFGDPCSNRDRTSFSRPVRA